MTGPSTTARSVLKIENLVAGYGGGDVLRGVSLEVAEGGITCVVGPNGAGKSTLMASISGLLRPRLGSITLDGQNIAGKSPRQVLSLGIVQVPQNHSLFRDMTVRENIELGGYILSDKALTARRVEAVFDLFPQIAGWDRQKAGSNASDEPVERQAVRGGRRLGDRKRHAHNGIGAESIFVGRAVQRDQRFVDLGLRLGIHAADGVENLAIDRIQGLAHALAVVARLVAVAKLDRLVRSGGGSRWHCGTAARPVLEHNVDLDGRITAAIKDLASDDVDDRSHDDPGAERSAVLLQDGGGSEKSRPWMASGVQVG